MSAGRRPSGSISSGSTLGTAFLFGGAYLQLEEAELLLTWPIQAVILAALHMAAAERLNRLGLGDAGDLALVETRVERTESTVRIVHLFEYGPHKARLLTEPFEGYGTEEA